MAFTAPNIPAILKKRYKRFLVDCTLESGEEITATCPNTGALLGCCDPGSKIWLSKSDSLTRKYAYTWEMVERADAGLIGINTARPNGIVEAAIAGSQVPALLGYPSIRREVKYSVNSRIDLLLESPDHPPCYVEVKNVSFIRKPGLAEFPDCRTERGLKHLHELAGMKRQGCRAVMVYLVQCASPTRFTFATDLDPDYVKAYLVARDAGVEAVALKCKMAASEIEIFGEIPIVEP